MGRSVILAVVIALTGVSAAGASEQINGQWQPTNQKFIGGVYIDGMLSLAQEHFGGQVPPCGPILVSLYDEPDPEIRAMADAVRCWILVPRKYWRSLWRRMNPIEFCDFMTHEYGHLLGLPHSNDFTNIMYPTPTNDTTECARSASAIPSPRPRSQLHWKRPWRWSNPNYR